jgi:hypothetical protein
MADRPGAGRRAVLRTALAAPWRTRQLALLLFALASSATAQEQTAQQREQQHVNETSLSIPRILHTYFMNGEEVRRCGVTQQQWLAAPRPPPAWACARHLINHAMQPPL